MCPSRVCSPCNKAVVEAVHCQQCCSFYHSGRLKHKSLRPGCPSCCRDAFSRYRLSQSVTYSLADAPPRAPSPPSAAVVPAPSSQPSLPTSAPIEALFEELTRKIERKFDEVRGRFDERFDEVDATLRARIRELERLNAGYAQDLTELHTTIADLQQHQQRDQRRASARLCEAELILSGVLCSSSDNFSALVSQVAIALGVPLADGDVSATRFLVSRSKARRNVRDSPIPLVIRFRSRELCLKLIQAKKAHGLLCTSDLNPRPPGPSTVIHINEALPADLYKLLVATRAAAKDRGYKYTWHSGGVVLVKRCDGAPTQRIRSLGDLEALEAVSPPASPHDSGPVSPAQSGPPRGHGRGTPPPRHPRGSGGSSCGMVRGAVAPAVNANSSLDSGQHSSTTPQPCSSLQSR